MLKKLKNSTPNCHLSGGD